MIPKPTAKQVFEIDKSSTAKQVAKGKTQAVNKTAYGEQEYDVLFKNAKEHLKLIERDITAIYKRYFEKQNLYKFMKLPELLSGLHEYLQAMFMLETVERGANEKQLQFIYSLFKRADLFEGVSGFKQLFIKCRRVLAIVPTAFSCLVAVDKTHDQNFSSVFINSVYGIYTQITQLQTNTKIKKKRELLANLITFAKERGVIIND